MTKAKELFDESTISNIHTAMILFEDETDIIKEELDYAEKCHNLEKELGCPLDVYVKATINGIIVDESEYQVKVRKNLYGYYFILSNGSCYPFYLKNYKKSWWLKKDKSE